VPLGTTRAGISGARHDGDEFCGNPGAFFIRQTAAERGADPRPSLQERYGSRRLTSPRSRQPQAKLVSGRFLLPEDARVLLRRRGSAGLDSGLLMRGIKKAFGAALNWDRLKGKCG
jgi:hypothetical protein